MVITNVSFRTHGCSSQATELHHGGKRVRFQNYLFLFRVCTLTQAISNAHIYGIACIIQPCLGPISASYLWEIYGVIPEKGNEAPKTHCAPMSNFQASKVHAKNSVEKRAFYCWALVFSSKHMTKSHLLHGFLLKLLMRYTNIHK